MKKRITAVGLSLFLAIIIPMVSIYSQAQADRAMRLKALTILKKMSLEDLILIKEDINELISESEEWQEVTVPEGVWEIGKDIPARHWSIRASGQKDYLYVSYFDILNDIGKGPGFGAQLFQQDIASAGFQYDGNKFAESVDIDMKSGWYFKNTGEVIFSPFIGKPDLGFK